MTFWIRAMPPASPVAAPVQVDIDAGGPGMAGDVGVIQRVDALRRPTPREPLPQEMDRGHARLISVPAMSSCARLALICLNTSSRVLVRAS